MNRSGGNLDVERVRDATDLVRLIGEHVKLDRKGREHVGVCPFHDDSSPSMHVVSHKGPGFYKCFACGASGDCFTFVKEYHRIEFREALQMLAERAGIPLQPLGGRGSSGRTSDQPTRNDLLEACRFALGFFRQTLAHPQRGTTGRDVIEQRGISPEMVEAFGIGYAPPGFDNLRERIEQSDIAVRSAVGAGLLKRRDSGGNYDAFRNRLMFPIGDEMGRPVAFGARIIDPEDTPKYLNSPETRIFNKSATLFGLHLARRAIVDAGHAIITEGYTDVIACHQAGVANVVGTLGTALTPDHAERLARSTDRAVLVFDGDTAGQKAADRAVAVFFRSNVDVRVCILPDGKDPDDFLREHGAEGFRAQVDGAEDALRWKLGRFRAAADPSAGVSAREQALSAFLDDLTDLGFAAMSTVRRQLVLDQLQRLLRIPVVELDGQLRRRETERAARARRDRDRQRARDARPRPAPDGTSGTSETSATRSTASAPAPTSGSGPGSAPARRSGSTAGNAKTAQAPAKSGSQTTSTSGSTSGPKGGSIAASTSAAAAAASSAPSTEIPVDADGRPLIAPGDVDIDPDDVGPLAGPLDHDPRSAAAPVITTAAEHHASPASEHISRARRLAERDFAALALTDAETLARLCREVAAVDAEARAAAAAALRESSDPDTIPPGRIAARLDGLHDGQPLGEDHDPHTAPALLPWLTARGSFADAAAHTVARCMAEWIAAGGSEVAPAPGTARIMDESPDESTRMQVATLHFEGERLSESARSRDASGPDPVAVALDALLECLGRERAAAAGNRARMDAAAGAMDAEGLAALIEERRRQGASPSAIARRPPGSPRPPGPRPGSGYRPPSGNGRSGRFSGPRHPAPPP
ncbi:MAG: DNA primase [Phycisphaerales bacterium]